MLSVDEQIRYAKHLELKDFGAKGQERLKKSSVAIIGVGGLGSPVALYLAAAGVGKIGLFDQDHVEISNLQRQVLHSTDRVGTLKVHSGKNVLTGLNPFIEVIANPLKITSNNVLELLKEYDTIVDCSDNFPTRYLISDASHLLGKPYVYGSVLRMQGQVSVFNMPDGPCYRCIFKDPPSGDLAESSSHDGIIGVLPGVIGSLMASETIKVLTGIGKTLSGRLLTFDALTTSFREISIKKDLSCIICGKSGKNELEEDYYELCGLDDDCVKLISPASLFQLLKNAPQTVIYDIREPDELYMGDIPSAVRLRLSDILQSGLEDEASEKPIIFACKEGSRSDMAIRLLYESGYSGPLLNLAGGTIAWFKYLEDTNSSI